MCRAHQLVQEGLKYMFPDKGLVTVCSLFLMAMIACDVDVVCMIYLCYIFSLKVKCWPLGKFYHEVLVVELLLLPLVLTCEHY